MCLVQFLANIIIIIIIIRFEDDMARYVCLTVTFLPCGLYKREGFVYLFLRMSTEHNTLITVFFFFFHLRTRQLLPTFPRIMSAVSHTLDLLHKCFLHWLGYWYLTFDWLLAYHSYIFLSCLLSRSPNWFIMQTIGSLLLLNLVIDIREATLKKAK